MTDTKRYFLCADLLDRARHEGSNAGRIARLEAWTEHLAEQARQAMRTPFTIDDLFKAFKLS